MKMMQIDAMRIVMIRDYLVKKTTVT